jgi:hypothetical protein
MRMLQAVGMPPSHIPRACFFSPDETHQKRQQFETPLPFTFSISCINWISMYWFTSCASCGWVPASYLYRGLSALTWITFCVTTLTRSICKILRAEARHNSASTDHLFLNLYQYLLFSVALLNITRISCAVITSAITVHPSP